MFAKVFASISPALHTALMSISTIQFWCHLPSWKPSWLLQSVAWPTGLSSFMIWFVLTFASQLCTTSRMHLGLSIIALIILLFTNFVFLGFFLFSSLYWLIKSVFYLFQLFPESNTVPVSLLMPLQPRNSVFHFLCIHVWPILIAWNALCFL